MAKILEKDIKADFHVHTIYSRDAHSTLQENMIAAKEQGLQFIGITNHFYNCTDPMSPKSEIQNIYDVQIDTYGNDLGINVIGGIELNFGQKSDYLEEIKGKTNLRLCGLHDYFWGVRHHTIMDVQGIVKDYIDRGYVNAVAHPERALDKLNNGKMGFEMTPALKEYFEWLVMYTKKNRVFLEVNETSLRRDDCGNLKRMIAWLKLAKENGNPLILGTDSHYCGTVGKFTRSIALLNKLGYPKELIVNCSPNIIRDTFLNDKNIASLDSMDAIMDLENL